MKKTSDLEIFNYITTNNILNTSGIYVFYREERGFKFAYVGLSVHCVERIFEHFHGYEQHIDLSLRKHGLYSEINPTGYKISIVQYCDTDLLDELEFKYCLYYANNGYQLRNTTSGSQGTGKFNLTENKSSKGYREGIRDGYNKARKELQTLFSKGYLSVTINGKVNTYKQRALEKLSKFLEVSLDETQVNS